MISITVYDITSGKILRKAMLSPEMVEANLSEGEGWIDGFYDPMLFVVEDGVAKKIDNEQLGLHRRIPLGERFVWCVTLISPHLTGPKFQTHP